MLSDSRPEWAALAAHHKDMANTKIRDLFTADVNRFQKFSINASGIMIDYSRHLVNDDTMHLLLKLARACDVEGWRDRMFNGEPINTSEDRPVLHTALRRSFKDDVRIDGQNIIPGIYDTLTRMRDLTNQVHAGKKLGHTGKPINTIVSIGIGGSDYGPRMAVEALKPYHVKGIRVLFVANVDGSDLSNTLAVIDPETTLFAIASKTFTTHETMINAKSARAWAIGRLGDETCVAKHFIALSTNREAVEAFGIAADQMYPFAEWVGGRYSLWSAIGLPIALAVGYDNFRQLLDGAQTMDDHFCTARLDQNIPVVMALLGIWYRNFCGYAAHAVIPYDQNLSLFSTHLQQLDMESNGKSVTRDGEFITYKTAPIIFGQTGTNAQHAFFQLLHQGTTIIPCDFIASFMGQNPYPDHHRVLLANMVAQADALMTGRPLAESGGEAARTFDGNRPSTIIMTDKLTPHALGQLVSIYEHKVFVQGIIWNINSFDQFGVELGKTMALKNLETLGSEHSGMTDHILQIIAKHQIY